MAQSHHVASDPPTPTRISRTRRDILQVLRGSPLIGLDIRAELEAYYEEELAHATIYENLAWLRKHELVKRRERDGRSHEYTLTEAGEQWLQAREQWIDEQAQRGAI